MVEPFPCLGEAGARHDLAFRCGCRERSSERLDPLRRDRNEHIDMLGGEPADPLVLFLVRRAQFYHAGGDQDAAAPRRAEHIE